MVKELLNRIPLERVNWTTSIFLMGTLAMSLTLVPYYIWTHGLDWFQVSLFFAFYLATGFSITLGYHRLFSHLSFKAKWPVKLFVLVFGSAAFENTALWWCSDHRKHHKHVDHEGDPYDITRGFWYAHIGWLMFKLNPEPPMDNVKDLEKDKLVMWQYKWNLPISFLVGFGLPALIGYLYGGAEAAWGAFLIGGVARIVFVQQGTFCINSLCHTIGKRPYSSKCSARDSWIAALVTFGEGYHNYHHEFQHDYRNGVKPWQFDPTKWTIWTLSKLGLITDLRRVPDHKILMAELNEAQRQVDSGMELFSIDFPESAMKLVEESKAKLGELSERFASMKNELQEIATQKVELSKEHMNAWQKEVRHGVRFIKAISEQATTVRKTS